jgi:hypothetical protein
MNRTGVADAGSGPKRGRILRSLAIALAVVLAVGLIASAFLLRDPRPYIERRRSHLVSATAVPAPAPASGVDSMHRVEHVHLRAASGLELDFAVKRPATDDAACTAGGGRRAIILLGGHRTGRNAVNLIADTRGTVVVALSYPFAGNHRVKGPAIAREVPGIRTAIFDTPAAVMLAMDYLVTQPCIDPARIEAVGVSLGAPFMVIAGAMDSRIARVWAVHGAGGIYEPLEFNLRRQLGSRVASVPLATLGSVLLAGERLAPERWAHEISPRPLVMVNALGDQRIPRHSVDRLYESAGEPKEMIWVPGVHVRSEAEAVRPLIDLVLTRITSESSGGAR